MAAFFNTTSSTLYRSADPVDNLLLRVSLRRRAAPGEAPVDAAPDQRPPDRAPGLEELVVDFSWQKKVFGPAELLRDLAAPPEAVGDAGHREWLADVRRSLAQPGGGAEDKLRVPPSGVLMYTITDGDMTLSRPVRLGRAPAPPATPFPPTATPTHPHTRTLPPPHAR